jgi:hypothetical protein
MQNADLDGVLRLGGGRSQKPEQNPGGGREPR